MQSWINNGMTTLQRTTVTILEKHGIAWKFENSRLYVLSVACKDSLESSEWLPIDNKNVYNWLGY